MINLELLFNFPTDGGDERGGGGLNYVDTQHIIVIIRCEPKQNILSKA
jgi:hypothetical protein